MPEGRSNIVERIFSPSERFLLSLVGFEEEGFKGLRSEVEERGVDIFQVFENGRWVLSEVR